jgi:phage terminase large subunit
MPRPRGRPTLRAQVPERTELYGLHPKQTQAMELLGWTPDTWSDRSGAVHELLYGGAVGGGKSMLARALAATIAVLVPGSIVPIFRKTYPELEENMIRRWLEEIPTSMGRYVRDVHEWVWPNGSVTEFRYCEREDDVHKYLSAEWEALIIDEATMFTPYVISMLRSRVRSTKPGWYETILYTSNPGNIGHTYFLNNFVNPGELGGYKPWKAPVEEGGLKRAFLTARLDDNPSLPDRYASIIEGINDPVLREAYKTGNWHIFAGQYFSTWRFDRHVIDPFDVPVYWRKWGGFDWGFGKPLSFGIYTKDPDTTRVYKIAQLYQAELTNYEAVHKIKALRGDMTLDVIYADPSIWARKSKDGRSTADDYQDLGITLTPANNNRIAGWQVLRDYLADLKDGEPGLQVFRNCYDTWRTFPTMVRDRRNPEDLDTDLEDHAVDETRYALASTGRAAAAKAVSTLVRKQNWQRYGRRMRLLA